MINLSEKISSLRKAHNLTQEALGEAVGVTAQAVSKWEKGDSLPDISVIPDICREFGISADALLGSEGNMTAEMYVDKALELCKGDMDEKMRLLHKIMAEGAAEKPHLAVNMYEAHVFTMEDSRGFGMFLSNIEYLKNIMSVDLSSNKLIEFMSDEKAIKIFAWICLNGRLTCNELAKLTGYSEQEVTERVVEFMKYNVFEPVMDTANYSNEMAYGIADRGISLIGIMANAYLYDRGRKELNFWAMHSVNPYNSRKFIQP